LDSCLASTAYLAMAANHQTITAVDSHAHVFVRGLQLTSRPRHAPDYDATLDEYLALLDEHDVSHAVLVQPSFLGTDNSFMLNAIRAQSQRLRGVAVVGVDAGDDQLRVLADGGIVGIRLNLIGQPIPDCKRAPWQRLLTRVRELDWHVELHSELHQLPLVGQPVLDAGCKLVVDHFGRPNHAGDRGLDWLLNAARCGRTWVKLSAGYRNWSDMDDPSACDAAQTLLDAFGATRLVWGSDWPHTQHRAVANYAAAYGALGKWVPDAAARRCILIDTPARLFHFSPGDNHAQ
jgi:predicted TIM-barrel fold metal-dependent hydrolase